MSKSRNHRISITFGMSGYFAVELADYEDMGFSTDVVQTGIGRYGTRGEAEVEAKQWAESEDLPFIG